MRCVVHSCNSAIVKAVQQPNNYGMYFPQLGDSNELVLENEEKEEEEKEELEEEEELDEEDEVQEEFPMSSLEEFVDTLKHIALQYRNCSSRTHKLRIDFEQIQSTLDRAKRKKFRFFALYSPTRWNSLVGMIQPFISNWDILKRREDVIDSLINESSTPKQKLEAEHIADFLQNQDTFPIICGLHFILAEVKCVSEELSCSSVDTLCNTLPLMFSIFDFLDNAKQKFEDPTNNKIYKLEDDQITAAAFFCDTFGITISRHLQEQWEYAIDFSTQIQGLSNLMNEEINLDENLETKFNLIIESMEPEKITIMSATFLTPHTSDFSFLLHLIDPDMSDIICPTVIKLVSDATTLKLLLVNSILVNFLSYLIEHQVEQYFIRKNKVEIMRRSAAEKKSKEADTGSSEGEEEERETKTSVTSTSTQESGKRKETEKESEHTEKRRKLFSKVPLQGISVTSNDAVELSASIQPEDRLNLLQINFMKELKRDLALYKNGCTEDDLKKSEKSPSGWWKNAVAHGRFPYLAQAARSILSPSPSSTSAERLFSLTRRVKTDLRGSMSNRNFEITSLYSTYMQDREKVDEFSRIRAKEGKK